MRSALLATAALSAAALAGCAAWFGEGPQKSLGRIAGRVVAAEAVPPDARIEVHRRDDSGLASPVVGFDVVPNSLGLFRTQPLPHGLYLLILRSRDVPPALAHVRVPQSGEIVLHAVLPAGATTIILTTPPTRMGTLRCRLAASGPVGGVLDLREVDLDPGEDVRVQGLVPGIWKLDVTNSAATTELAVAAGHAPQRFLVDPPPPENGVGAIEGTVKGRDGAPARGVVVSAWSMSPDRVNLETWGRQSEVGPDGRFLVLGLRPGPGMVRVELRGAAHRLLPDPEMIEIPPSGRLPRAFRVDP